MMGYIQLYNSQLNASQPIEGFCPTFGSIKCNDDNQLFLLSFIDKKANNPNYELMITDLAPNKRVNVKSDIQDLAENDHHKNTRYGNKNRNNLHQLQMRL